MEYDVTPLISNENQEDLKVNFGAYKVFQWYNWGARDFELQVDPSLGDVEVFLNYQSDIEYTTTLIASIPISESNSIRQLTVAQNTRGSVVIKKSDLQSFCYYCFYFITVRTTKAKASFDI